MYVQIYAESTHWHQTQVDPLHLWLAGPHRCNQTSPPAHYTEQPVAKKQWCIQLHSKCSNFTKNNLCHSVNSMIAGNIVYFSPHSVTFQSPFSYLLVTIQLPFSDHSVTF